LLLGKHTICVRRVYTSLFRVSNIAPALVK
jgi:hypothetical protein